MISPGPPAGTRLVADPGLRTTSDGRAFIGGTPLRIVRVSGRGAAVVADWIAGTPVADAADDRRLARRLLDAGMVHPVVGRREGIDVTVVVPVRDELAGLARCLASLEGAEVVVVDDGSLDGAAVRRVSAPFGARVLRRATSEGPGAARNHGMAAVDTDLVAFIDADVEASPGWIERLAGHLVDSEVVAVAPRVRSRPGPTLRERYERVHSPLDLGDAPARVTPSSAVSYVPSAAVLARAEAVRAVRGFDPALRWGEDVDLVWRLGDAGGTVRYEPAVEVTHAPRPTWRRWIGQRRRYGGAAAPLASRHGRRTAPVRCSGWSAAVWGAVATGHPIVAAAVAGATVVALGRKLGGLDEPGHEALRLGGTGHLLAGRALARAVSRAWWPIATVAAITRPRLRVPVLVALAAPATLEWLAGSRPTDPLRSISLRLVDDVAYSIGVWEGAVRERSFAAVAPDFVDWPGRRAAVESETVGAVTTPGPTPDL